MQLFESAGKILLGRPELRWEDNVRMGLREKGTNMRNFIDLAEDGDYW